MTVRSFTTKPDLTDLLDRIWEHFDRDEFDKICQMDEEDFAIGYGFDRYAVNQPAPDDFFLFRAADTSGREQSRILAVAHLDTVARAEPYARRAQFLDTEGGTVVYSRALDDRLGAYIILDLLPKLGLHFDVLLTVGEENGRSTAAFFDVPQEVKDRYHWMIEFDRGGTDVVMYQYDDAETRALVRACGATPEDGIFSDISFLEHLGIKGFNWGVGYRDYHGPKSHAWLDDTFEMLAYFLIFHEANAGVPLPHTADPRDSWWSRGSRYANTLPEWVEADSVCAEHSTGVHEWRVIDGTYAYCMWCDAEQEEGGEGVTFDADLTDDGWERD